MKNVFTIEPDVGFLDTLAAELWARAAGDGMKLAQDLVLLPTRRSCRHLGAAFARLAGDRPVLLPRLRPLGDGDEDEMAFADDVIVDLPPAIAPLKRLMLLTQQVQKRDPSLSADQAAQAAEALAKFLDQAQIERCDMSKLPTLVERADLALHWQQTLQFLDIVTRFWPGIVREQGCIDPQERRNAVLAAQAEIWRRTPPAYPVIAAGSTGSVPATAELLGVIAGLPQGAVILPGLDRAMSNEGWAEIAETHPQHGMKKLLEKIGVDRREVNDFGRTAPPSPRTRLLREAMRPARLTEGWRALRGELPPACVAGLTRLVLDHPQEEAQAVALRLRAFLETPEGNAAFVTSDRGLAARVAALLRRWNIAVDDSGGMPLALTPPGAFLNLTLAAASPFATASDMLALLKHPLAACGTAAAQCRAAAREAELRARRGEDENFAGLRALLAPVTQNWRRPLPLARRIAAHIAAAEAVAASDAESGADRLWRGENGEAAAAWLDEWRNGAGGLPDLGGGDYAALFGSLAATQIIRSQQTTHPRLGILGPLEARLISADLVVLGGLNEGSWPPDAGFDPWMSRPMREKFGLPSPEFRIGLSAHDFAQLASAPEVMLTRSARSGGAPTVPSRFLLQIDAVLRAAGLSDATDALAPPQPWRAWANLLDRPAEIAPCPRPRPRPPVEARPTALSVTEISTWLRNPYAIYARHILKLAPLEELDAELDAADRGTMIHAALEKFAKTYRDDLPPDAGEKLLQIGRAIFARDRGDPRVQAFWAARFAGIAKWFVAHERARRGAGIVLVGAEAAGQTRLGAFTLRGKADRIDRLPDGALALVDYKTGGVPKEKEVLSGLQPQLPLLALIAERGGFGGFGGRARVLEYWQLKGGRQDGKVVSIAGDIAALVREAEAGVAGLAAKFADPRQAYDVAPRARFMPEHDPYAHLARSAEWGREGDDA